MTGPVLQLIDQKMLVSGLLGGGALALLGVHVSQESVGGRVGGGSSWGEIGSKVIGRSESFLSDWGGFCEINQQ